jgi:hypothetical protein
MFEFRRGLVFESLLGTSRFDLPSSKRMAAAGTTAAAISTAVCDMTY